MGLVGPIRGFTAMGSTGTASLTINELREFASFTSCEQRYIKRSLDVGLGRRLGIRPLRRVERDARDPDPLGRRPAHVVHGEAGHLAAVREPDLDHTTLPLCQTCRTR